MKYDLCSSCMYFQPRLMTLDKVVPKSCNHEAFKDVFSPSAGGFPSGIDVIHCDYHKQFPVDYGDVKLIGDKGQLSYVLTKAREFKLVRVPQLYDNEKNIKTYSICQTK